VLGLLEHGMDGIAVGASREQPGCGNEGKESSALHSCLLRDRDAVGRIVT
jgi:hypothetical protein